MSIATHKCGGCGTIVRRDDSPLAPNELRPRRMTFSTGALHTLVVDLCDVCSEDAQDASRERVQHIAEREESLNAPEVATVREDESEHQAVIEGSNEGQQT